MKCQKNKKLTLNDAYKYLDYTRFQLSIEIKWTGLKPYKEFKLFRRYPNGDYIYYSDDNKIILSGDDKNECDVKKLVDYLKDHQKVDVIQKESIFITIYSMVLANLAVVNLTCMLLRTVPISITRFMTIAILSSEIPLLILTIIRSKYSFINHKVDLLEQYENLRMGHIEGSDKK